MCIYIYNIYIYIERDPAGQFGDVWGACDDVANSSQISLAYRGLSPVSLHILLKLTKLNHHDRTIFGVKSSRTIGSLTRGASREILSLQAWRLNFQGLDAGARLWPLVF